MRRLWHILCFGLLAMVCSNTSSAQILKDPTHWTYEAKKISDDEYELSFKLTLDKGWHIYALNPGGDGTLIAPTFDFEKSKGLKMIDSIKENGKLISKAILEDEEKVNYYSDKVTYTQIVKAPNGSEITGTHSYQVCTDEMCLPPKDAPFSFQLK